MSVRDPLGLQRCASCSNAYSYDRGDDGRCRICGGWFDGQPAARSVERWRVEELHELAGKVGHDELAATCRRALGGDQDALAEVAAILDEQDAVDRGERR